MSHTQQDYGYYILRVKERDGSWWDGSLAPDGSLTVIEHV